MVSPPPFLWPLARPSAAATSVDLTAELRSAEAPSFAAIASAASSNSHSFGQGAASFTASMNADFSFRKRVEELMGLIEGR
jgi:hypothetical protein